MMLGRKQSSARSREIAKAIKRDAHVFDIDWDTDGESVDLPEEVRVWLEPESGDIEDFEDEEGIEAKIADILTEEYGWCVNDFDWEWIDSAPDRSADAKAVGVRRRSGSGGGDRS